MSSTWYSGTNFTVDLNLTDGQKHQVELYLLDWDNWGRSERVDILDAATGAVLDSQSASSLVNGKYLVWTLIGHVRIKLTNTGPQNAVLSGLFLDAPGATTTPPPTSGTATFVKVDTTTQGTWKGVYGSQGYNVVGDAASYPNFAMVNPNGNLNYTWSSSTTDVRALQKSSATATDRMASTWYSPTSFTVDVNLTDGQKHQVELYLLDWDNWGRTERVDILDAATGTVLDSQSVSSIANGKYLVWTLSGHVQIKITNTGPQNAVLSGIFFG